MFTVDVKQQCNNKKKYLGHSILKTGKIRSLITVRRGESSIMANGKCHRPIDPSLSMHAFFSLSLFFRDTVIVCIGDFFTCIFAGFVIFSYLGFMAGKQSTTVDKVAQSG